MPTTAQKVEAMEWALQKLQMQAELYKNKGWYLDTNWIEMICRKALEGEKFN